MESKITTKDFELRKMVKSFREAIVRTFPLETVRNIGIIAHLMPARLQLRRGFFTILVAPIKLGRLMRGQQ